MESHSCLWELLLSGAWRLPGEENTWSFCIDRLTAVNFQFRSFVFNFWIIKASIQASISMYQPQSTSVCLIQWMYHLIEGHSRIYYSAIRVYHWHVSAQNTFSFFYIAGLKFSMNKSQDALVPRSPVTSRDEEAWEFGSCMLKGLLSLSLYLSLSPPPLFFHMTF